MRQPFYSTTRVTPFAPAEAVQEQIDYYAEPGRLPALYVVVRVRGLHSGRIHYYLHTLDPREDVLPNGGKLPSYISEDILNNWRRNPPKVN